ncbi:MAG: Asp-tRNA(Asn)/Glu-tRNA(Gln) amidotransferase subunit GatA [Candidatus Xiphinematobacter sp.]|nr:MAG: Asp-tRNA(Asn)/Glu-tRNA(Gln) amidotransferase subunit GatA [Candidatus Xiphinematobacter sp.]
MEITALTLHELQRKFRTKELHPRDAIKALEERIVQVEPRVKSLLHRDIESAMQLADRADVSLPLGGLPVAIKDAIHVKGDPCTCASRMLAHYCAPYDATVITRLRAAGAIPFTRTNMDEFSMGSSNETSAIQPTCNPWDLQRIPGGSSGGSAAAVAAREAFAALGSDTGGSIRQPAAFCGCVGLKPTYGRVSRYGLVALASSLDQIGPLARSTRDCAMVFNAISGNDPKDSTCLKCPQEDFTHGLNLSVKGLRLGIPKEYFVDGIDSQVRSAVEKVIQQCRELGAEIIELSLPHTKYAVNAYYILATAEASSNLARFDGVRYGYRAEGPQNLFDHYRRSREEGFGSEVKRRIILGTYVLSSGYYDAYYLRAQRVRTLIREDFKEAFSKVDALICPTSPDVAFRLGERRDNPLRMYLADIFTIATNLAGICGISVPCGFAKLDGSSLPIGVQFLGNALEEAKLLRLANAYELASGWTAHTAPL